MESKIDFPSLKKSAIFSLGHFMTDIYPAFLPPLLPLLMDKFQLSFTRASFLGMILSFSSSLTQPIFGYLSDKFGGRKFMIMGPLVAGSRFQLHRPGLGLLGDFGSHRHRRAGGRLRITPKPPSPRFPSPGGRELSPWPFFPWEATSATASAPFSFSPSSPFSDSNGAFSRPSRVWEWPGCFTRKRPLWKRCPFPSPRDGVPFPGAAANQRLNRFLILMAVVILRITTVVSLLTFLPTIQNLRGFSLVVAGSSFTVFMICGAAGGMTGGFLSDRVGRKPLIVASFILTLPVFIAFLFLRGPFSFLPLAFLGFLLFLSEPAGIVLAQELAPHKTRIASSMVMGLAWGIGGIGVAGDGRSRGPNGDRKHPVFSSSFCRLGALSLAVSAQRENDWRMMRGSGGAGTFRNDLRPNWQEISEIPPPL